MLWRLFFRALYRLLRLLDPLLRLAWRARLPMLPRSVEVRVSGRRTGTARSTLVTLLTVDDRLYVGHPNGPAGWTRNLDAVGKALLGFEDDSVEPVRAVRLFAGPERESVIRATWSQQPFPGNVIYSLARRHVRDVGVYYRLVPAGDYGGDSFRARARGAAHPEAQPGTPAAHAHPEFDAGA
ncbi:MAG: hypothetical protein H0V87_02620 [Chloroflexi bacterium]|nr:hypothetical protein [Chloroflexota bacterium]